MSSSEKDRHADTVIRNHALFSTAAGAIPIALADIAAVSAVQLDMIRQLCDVYEADFSVTRGKALVTAITSAALARAGAASLVKLVPIAGTLVGSVGGAALAGASSFALGQAFKTHLSTGGTFLDIEPERLKRIYREQFEKGKEAVRTWQREGGAATKGSAADGGPASAPKSGFDFSRMRYEANAPKAADPERNGSHVATPDQPDGAGLSAPGAAVATGALGVAEASAGADAAAASTGSQAQAGRPTTRSMAARLAELDELNRGGLIDADEYAAMRRKLLGEL